MADVTLEFLEESLVIEFPNTQGEPGPAGANGPPGPAGGTGPRAYTHEQLTASNNWIITHNLGFNPNILIEDSSGDLVIPHKIIQDGINQTTIQFLGIMSGKAYLS